jgi:predicted ArsR family transcriptional regulator
LIIFQQYFQSRIIAMARPLDLSPAQLRVMASSMRMALIGALAQDGAQSARELAERMGRPVSGLYHHLDLLESVGIIQVSVLRPGPRRPEKIYALTAAKLSSRAASTTKAGRAALAKACRQALAAASRSVGAALTSGAGVTEGPGRDTAVRRVQVRMSARALARFNADVDDLIERAMANATLNGHGLEITLAIAPTARRKSKRS